MYLTSKRNIIVKIKVNLKHLTCIITIIIIQKYSNNNKKQVYNKTNPKKMI